MKQQIVDALKAHALGHIQKHKINALNLMENPAGIGEHGDIIEEIEKELKYIAEYEDQLDVLSKYF